MNWVRRKRMPNTWRRSIGRLLGAGALALALPGGAIAATPNVYVTGSSAVSRWA